MQLTDDVLVFREIGRLDLTTAQLREITQLLSTLDRTTRDYQDREQAAGQPIQAQLQRVRAALATGLAPEPRDQEAVTAALAPLRSAAVKLEAQQRETVAGIRNSLTVRQHALLEEGAEGGANQAGIIDRLKPAGGGGPGQDQLPPEVQARQQQLQAELAQRQAQMQALGAAREDAQRQATQVIDQLRKEMEEIQQQLQKLEQENAQPKTGAPGDGGAPDIAGDPGAAIQREVENARREAEMAQRRAELVQRASQRQAQMAQTYAEFARRQAEMVQQMAQVQAEAMRIAAQQAAVQQGAAAIPGEPARTGDANDEAIRRLFFHPGVFSFLRARAAQ